jgi:hypothetical protein
MIKFIGNIKKNDYQLYEYLLFLHKMTATVDQSKSIRKIVSDFMNNVDNSKDYTLKELDKILEKSYKKNGEPAKKKVPKAPTAYNTYIKTKIAELKAENSNINPKDLMKLAAGSWSEAKKSIQPPIQETTEELPEKTTEEPHEEEPKTPRATPEPTEVPNAPKKPTKKSVKTTK